MKPIHYGFVPFPYHPVALFSFRLNSWTVIICFRHMEHFIFERLVSLAPLDSCPNGYGSCYLSGIFLYIGGGLRNPYLCTCFIPLRSLLQLPYDFLIAVALCVASGMLLFFSRVCLHPMFLLESSVASVLAACFR